MKTFLKSLLPFLGGCLYLAQSQSTTELNSYIPPPDRSDIAEVCARNDHFTDPNFTCCASKRYPVPKFYSNPDASCFGAIGSSDKIVKSSWQLFKCLVHKALGDKPFSLEAFGDILSSQLPGDVKMKIMEILKAKTETNSETSPYFKQEQLKEYELYVNAWQAYYMAENKVCTELGGKNQTLQIDEDSDSHKCFNWINQNTRRGDCCNRLAIPYPLHPDPIVDQYYALKNWTATKLFTLLGEDYDWGNTTVVMYSNNIAVCSRTAMLIQQGVLSLDQLKAEIASQTPPNYREIAEKLIPKFMGKDTREGIQLIISNYTGMVEMDSDITYFNDVGNVYKVADKEEWRSKRINENATRILFWNCFANNLIVRRYKEIEMSELCY